MTGLALCWNRAGSVVDPEVRQGIAAALPCADHERLLSWSDASAASPWIVQASADGAQPVVEPEGVVIAVDGRLDFEGGARTGYSSDYASVFDRNTLAMREVRHRWRDRFAEHMIGDYAFAIWEPRSQTLRCGRDVPGARPLYYGMVGDDVVISTALACVLAHPRLRGVANEGMIAEVLADKVVSRDETLYRDAHRVPPGHVLEVERGAVRVHRVRSIEPGAPLNYQHQQEYEEHYRAVLGRAVADRLVGSGPVAAELSGGLDSSSVTALAAQQMAAGGAELSTYSLLYPGLVDDERHYIDAMAARHDLRSHVVAPQPPSSDRLREEVGETGDVPVPPNVAGIQALLRSARTDGQQIVLTGQGGDQWFDGSSWYPSELLRGGNVRASLNAAHLASPNRSTAGAATTNALRPLVGSLARRIVQPTQALPRWIPDAFADRVGLADRLDSVARPHSSASDRIAMTVSGAEALGLETLARLADSVGVAYRHPYYDSRLVEFALALPEGQRWLDGQTRAIQRRSLGGMLPSIVRARTTKADFSRLLCAEFARQGGRNRFASLAIGDLGWVDSGAVLGLYDDMQDALAECGSPRNIWPLWRILAVDAWTRAPSVVLCP